MKKRLKNKMLISPDDLIEFMGKENYNKFILKLIERSKHIDYDEIPKEKYQIWIEAQW